MHSNTIESSRRRAEAANGPLSHHRFHQRHVEAGGRLGSGGMACGTLPAAEPECGVSVMPSGITTSALSSNPGRWLRLAKG
jgi:hypothetical protein